MGNEVDDEKRNHEKPIPDNLDDLLNDFQLMALRRIEGFGWELRFVRRPVFQTPTAVVFSLDGEKIGVLGEDARTNMESEIKIRKPSRPGCGMKQC